MDPADKRLLHAIAGRPVDTHPFWLMRQAGRYLPEYRRVRAEAGSFLDLCFTPPLAAEVTIQPIRRFGMDAAILFSDILLVPYALGQKLAFQEGEGPKLEPVRSAADLTRLATTPDLDRLEPVYETIRLVKRALPETTALIGFAGAPWTLATYAVEGGSSRGFEIVRRWAESDPEGFRTLIDRLADAVALHLERQIAAGAEVVQIFDSWAAAAGDSGFEPWILAPTRRIVAGLKARWPQVPVIGFPKGIGARAAEYARATGVDMVSIGSDLDPGMARDIVQPVAGVQGNLDPALLVAGGAAMEQQVRRIVDALGRGRFVFNLGHGVVPETPPEHVAALAALLRSIPAGV
jgi:uroporphyrinogen decarboxylase